MNLAFIGLVLKSALQEAMFGVTERRVVGLRELDLSTSKALVAVVEVEVLEVVVISAAQVLNAQLWSQALLVQDYSSQPKPFPTLLYTGN